MKKIIFLLLFVTSLVEAATPQVFSVKKNTEVEIAFPLTASDAEGLAVGVTGATCSKSIDGATPVATTNSFSAIGGGWYKLTLTASEVNGKYLTILCSGAYYDKTILVTTYGSGGFHTPETVSSNVVSVDGNAVTSPDDFKADVSDVAEDVWSYATRTLTANGLTSDSVSSAAANKIADHVMRRSTANIEASSDGDTLNFKSLYGVAAQQTHKSAISAGNWIVYRANGSTTLNTRSVSSSGSASPIVGAD